MSHWENQSQSGDWRTPKWVFEALGVAFDLDVAGPEDGSHVPCDYIISANSLSLPWTTPTITNPFVWANPPYERRNGLAAWLTKFVKHGNGIALVPDRTSAPWFQDAAVRIDAILFTAGKIKFETIDGFIGESPSNGSALLACGAQAVAALQQARDRVLGLLVIPQKRGGAIMTRILAIDPGSVSAAWAIVDTDTGLALVDDVPVADRMICAVGFAQLVHTHCPTVAIIEAVSAMPAQGARSGFKFGMGTGILRGVLGALSIPLHEVSPIRCKRAFGIGPDKEKARALAIRLYPTVQGLARKKDHGCAEALLLARWFLTRGATLGEPT